MKFYVSSTFKMGMGIREIPKFYGFEFEEGKFAPALPCYHT
jgi:hypothetical protein